MDILENAVKEKMTGDIDGTRFYIYLHRNGQDTAKLISDVKNLIAEHNLSASEAKGFCEYMKLVIDSSSYLHSEK